MSPVGGACPRCNASFHCGVADASPCACTTLTLDESTLAKLRARYDGCLCVSCLVELQGAKETKLDPKRQ